MTAACEPAKIGTSVSLDPNVRVALRRLLSATANIPRLQGQGEAHWQRHEPDVASARAVTWQKSGVVVTESSLQWPRGLACTLLPDLCKKHCRWCAGEMRVDSLPGNAVVAFTCSRSPESTFTHSPLAFQLAVSLCVVTPAAVLCDPTSDAAEHGTYDHRPCCVIPPALVLSGPTSCHGCEHRGPRPVFACLDVGQCRDVGTEDRAQERDPVLVGFEIETKQGHGEVDRLLGVRGG